MKIGIRSRIDRARNRVKLDELGRKVRPAERADELAEREHQHLLAQQALDFKRQQEETNREIRQARKDKARKDRAARRARVLATLGALIQGNLGWLSAQWLALRAWIADRIVAVPVLVAAGSALYGQFGYLHDPTSPQYPGDDSTGMGWVTPVALAAGLAVEVMAFVIFRARKRGLDAGDDVRLETATGWGIVSGAVWFNATHVDPLAGFLSAIGPIAWEIRERRERRNREIDNGTRGKAPLALPRLSIRFWRFYRAEYRAMLRIALWERARYSYPNLVARVENETAGTRLADSVERLANLVAANPVQLTAGPGSTNVSSHAVLALEPGSVTTSATATPAATTEPGPAAEPGSTATATSAPAEPGSAEPGFGTRSADQNPVGADQIQVVVTRTNASGTDLITQYPVLNAEQVSARFTATEPGSEPGSRPAAAEPGSTEPGSRPTASTTIEPGSSPAVTEPGPDAATTTAEPGSVEPAAADSITEPGSPVATEPGSTEPGSPVADGVTSDPVAPAESELEQTRPMPRLVHEPGSANPVRNLDELRAEDARKVKECVDLCVALLDAEKRWVGREEQLKHLREEHNIRGLNNRVRAAWWSEMQQYRDVVRAAKTG